jgi:hypothetical protein
MYVSPKTSEYFIIIADRFCKEQSHPLFRNDAYAVWKEECCGSLKLHFYVDLGNEGSVASLTRYLMYKELLHNYIKAIAHVDRQLISRHRHLRNCPISVHFKSCVEKFNITENYGTLRCYCLFRDTDDELIVEENQNLENQQD